MPLLSAVGIPVLPAQAVAEGQGRGGCQGRSGRAQHPLITAPITAGARIEAPHGVLVQRQGHRLGPPMTRKTGIEHDRRRGNRIRQQRQQAFRAQIKSLQFLAGRPHDCRRVPLRNGKLALVGERSHGACGRHRRGARHGKRIDACGCINCQMLSRPKPAFYDMRNTKLRQNP